MGQQTRNHLGHIQDLPMKLDLSLSPQENRDTLVRQADIS